MATPQQMIGHFRVTAKLGAGGMGEVWRATDTRLNREVAIKVLPATFATDPTRMARFKQEAQVLASLNHPGIATIFGVEDSALVMELVEGPTLAERIARGKIPLDEALPIATQIADALEYAHERGIVHRDLKPANIKVTPEGRVKVLDFGLAKAMSTESGGSAPEAATLSSPATLAGTILGTAAYMAPEQARGQNVDRRADIWAFGVVLHEMLTGQRPFGGPTTSDTLASILTREPDLSKVTEPARSVIAGCLQKDRRDRWGWIGDVRLLLEHSPTATPAAVPARRLRWLAAPTLVAVIIAGALGAWWLQTRSGAAAGPPQFQRLTYAQGGIRRALFLPDGHTVVATGKLGSATQWEPFLARLDSPAVQPLNSSPYTLLAVSGGTVAILQGIHTISAPEQFGTLALMPLIGGAPRPLFENIEDATFYDHAANGDDAPPLLVVRYHADSRSSTVEFPPGHVLAQNNGWYSSPRFSRDGKLIAILEHPHPGDDGGPVLILDRSGRTVARGPYFDWAQGLAWSPNSREVWYSASQIEVKDLHALALNGRDRLLLTGPMSFFLEDVQSDGTALVRSDDSRISAMAVTPDHPEPRDFTVLDWTNQGTVSADGKYFLLGEEGVATNPDNLAAYLARADGSPPVNLGRGYAMDISSDNQWVLSKDVNDQLWLLPVGTGSPRQLTHGNVVWDAARFATGRQLVVGTGHAPGRPERDYLAAWRGAAKPLTPEGVVGVAVTPDGKYVLTTGNGDASLFPLDGGAPRLLPEKLPAHTSPLRFGTDDNTLFVRYSLGGVHQVFRFNLASGAQQLVFTLPPPDRPGMGLAGVLGMSADGGSYLYDVETTLSTLYIIRGLH